MVIQCDNNEDIIGSTYTTHFDKYSFPLSIFQKIAIKAIVDGHHSLSCVPTGSGKTLPALFAIDFFTSIGKKVIYTSPIKALSNQKYYEFIQKFPSISIGLLTGDIKINPEAQVLIMTAEILQNTLYRKKHETTSENNNKALLHFDMDFENELACVIQDEIHMINDKERGHVWENTILLLPNHIQMVMLSATLDNPLKFASWIENNNTEEENKKMVYLATSNIRPVPLTHYSFITTPQSIFKAIKNKDIQAKIRNDTNKLHTIQTSNGTFNEDIFHKIKSNLLLFQKNNIHIKRSFVLNQVCKYMMDNNMLPAVCFILSRKQIELAAHEIGFSLLDADNDKLFNRKQECEKLLRNKLPNFREYLELPEYINMLKLLDKGIAIHHSGVMPILREMVEILFEKGYIKLLFATETFSVGLNMPIKTVLFTDVKKFDGTHRRMLYSHEYIQASGRAGRRGIDTVGNVIHLNNLFNDINLTEYRTMLHGKPQTLISKFKISYNLVLNLIENGITNYNEYCSRSMIQTDINYQVEYIKQQITDTQGNINNMKNNLQYMRTPYDDVNKYITLSTQQKECGNNKKRKQIERDMKNIEQQYKSLKMDIITVNNYQDTIKQLTSFQDDYTNSEQYLPQKMDQIIKLLLTEEYISVNENMNKCYDLTNMGNISTNIHEVPSLTFGALIHDKIFDDVTVEQLIQIFSCFTNIVVNDDYISYHPATESCYINEILINIKNKNMIYYDYEINNTLNTGVDYTMHYDLVKYVERWCHTTNEQECKQVLTSLEQEKGIFLGEFIKAILKINNISSELEKVAEYIGDISLLHKLKQIPNKTLKYIATNQSLYI